MVSPGWVPTRTIVCFGLGVAGPEGEMAKALVLRAITGTQAGKRHTLTARVSTVGSASNNDLVLHDRLLNPRHIEIRQVLERWFVVPVAQNSQGVALNGMPVSSQSRLNPGDALTLGSVTYMVELEEVLEQEFGAPPDDFLAERNESIEQIQQIHHRRAAAGERHHIGREARLQRRVAIELVQHDVGHRLALQLDHQAHAVAVALVTDLGDTLDLLVAYHLGDTLVQARLVLLIGDFRDDDRFAAAAALLYAGSRPHDDRATPQLVGGADAVATEDGRTGREIRPGDVLHHLLDRERGIIDQRAATVDQLAEIMRRDVGRHADGDTARAIGQQIGKGGRKDSRFLRRLVVVGLEVDRVEVDVVTRFKQPDGVQPPSGYVYDDKTQYVWDPSGGQLASAKLTVTNNTHQMVMGKDHGFSSSSDVTIDRLKNEKHQAPAKPDKSVRP